MGIEIEHKFLADPSKLSRKVLGVGQRLFQGYMSDKPTVRVRIIDGKRAELTIKGQGTLVKPEFNYDIPVADAEAMKPMLKAVLQKTRYHVEFGGFIWDVDEFHGSLSGLWLAEIELPTAKTKFKKPKWAQINVTEDGRYSNAKLAKNGWPKG